MPNHITNIVSVAGKQGLKTLLSRFLDFDAEEAGVLDFKKVIPMPEAMGFRDENLPISPQSNTAIARAYESNERLYGFKNWYDWSVAKWGTKWNCYEFSWVTEKKCTFLTAWSTPDPILQKMSDVTGKRIRNRWMDEGDGKWHTDIFEPAMVDEGFDCSTGRTYPLLVSRKVIKGGF